MYDHKQSAREIFRHMLFRCGLIGVLDMARAWRGKYTKHMHQHDLSTIFSQIYANDVWVERKNQDSLSGVGSTQHATKELVDRLSSYLKNINCQQLVDIGCGDFNWMRNVEGDFDYLGIDVVPQLIQRNNATYASSKRRFICMNAVEGPIPQGDVAICREVVFHLSFHNGLQLLRNIKAAGFKYVLLTSDKVIYCNSDIRNGDFRPINLSKSPYKLPSPLHEFQDDKASNGRVLGVWAVSELSG